MWATYMYFITLHRNVTSEVEVAVTRQPRTIGVEMSAAHAALATLSAVREQLRLEREQRRAVQLELRNERAQRQAAQNALAVAQAQLESQRELIQQLQQLQQQNEGVLNQERRTSRILEQQLSRTQDQLTTAQGQLTTAQGQLTTAQDQLTTVQDNRTKQMTTAHEALTTALGQVDAMQTYLSSTNQALHMTQAQLTASISLNNKLVDAAMLCGIASLSKKKKIRASMPFPAGGTAAILAGEEDDSQQANCANANVSSGIPKEARTVAKHDNAILKKRRVEDTV